MGFLKKLKEKVGITEDTAEKGLETGRDLDEMEKSWQEELERFLAKRRQYLLY